MYQHYLDSILANLSKYYTCTRQDQEGNSILNIFLKQKQSEQNVNVLKDYILVVAEAAVHILFIGPPPVRT